MLKVAILGCGAVSELYYAPALGALERLDRLKVVVLFDPQPTRVRALQNLFPAASTCSGMDELLAAEIDLAVVASPPQHHAGQTIRLLERGISVLCEKPMALTLADGEAMAAAAAASPGLLAVGLTRRFFPAVQAIRQTLALGLLGPVKSFTCQEGGVFQWPVQSAAYFSPDGGQGGVLFDLGVHALDLLIWWWGYPLEIFYEDDAMGGVETNCRIRLKFAGGFGGEVRLSRDCPLPNRYLIECEKGWISWNVNEAEGIQMGFTGADFTLASRLHGMPRPSGPLPALGRPGFNFEQCFISQLCNVAGAIEGTETLAVPAEQGLPSLKAIAHCCAYRSLLPLPWLGEQETRRARELSAL